MEIGIFDEGVYIETVTILESIPPYDDPKRAPGKQERRGNNVILHSS
jgi:hypothetical protein